MPLNIFDEYVSFFLKLCVSFFRSVTFRFADYIYIFGQLRSMGEWAQYWTSSTVNFPSPAAVFVISQTSIFVMGQSPYIGGRTWTVQ